MSFTNYLIEKEQKLTKQQIQDEGNAFYWHQLESEVGHQKQCQICNRLDNHFGRIASQIYHWDSENLANSMTYTVLFRLVYGLGEAQERYQHNQRHYEAERSVSKVGQYTLNGLYELSAKELIGRLTKAFNRDGYIQTETASRTLIALKKASEATLIQMANSLLGDK